MSVDSERTPRNCLEISALTYAVIVTIFTGLTCAVSGVWLFVQVILIVKDSIRPYEDGSYAYASILVAVLILSSIAFAFSYLLALGILKRRPEHVKAYFVYGNIALLLMAAAGVISILLLVGLLELEYLLAIGFSTFIVCIVYSAILSMIWATYKQLRKGTRYQQVVVVDGKY